MDAIRKTLEQLMDAGWNAKKLSEYLSWMQRVKAFLIQTLGNETATEFLRVAMGPDPEFWEVCRNEVMGMLEGIVAVRFQLEVAMDAAGGAASAVVRATMPSPNGFLLCTGMTMVRRKWWRGTWRDWGLRP